MERRDGPTADDLVRFFRYLSGPYGHNGLVPVADTMFVENGSNPETVVRIEGKQIQILGRDGDWYAIDPFDAWRNYGVWLDWQIGG